MAELVSLAQDKRCVRIQPGVDTSIKWEKRNINEGTDETKVGKRSGIMKFGEDLDRLWRFASDLAFEACFFYIA